MLDGPMGPGFFIFFRNPIRTGAGTAGEPVFEELPAEVVHQTYKVFEKYKAAGLNKENQTQGGLTYDESIEAIAASITESIDEKHVLAKVDKFEITEEEALRRFKATITAILQDDELALILIMANI